MLAGKAAQLVADPLYTAFAQQPMGRVDPIPQKIQRAARLAYREYLRLAIGGQAQAVPQKRLDHGAPAVQLPLVVVNHYKVVHIAGVIANAQIMLGVAIQLVQIEIGKQLTGQVAKGDAHARRAGAGINDGIQQRQGTLARHSAAQQRL